jgi:FkbM family methyltransferase
MRRGQFWPDDPDVALLPEWVHEGDWVIDVGANVGTYAWAFSNLVGSSGRVICFEPVPATFATLAANVRRFPHANVSLVNAAVSREAGVAHMVLPEEYGHERHFYARIDAAGSSLTVLTLGLDGLALGDAPITLVKIDVEGHEDAAVDGMMRLLTRHRPRLIVEGSSSHIESRLRPLGYRVSRQPGSPNTLYTPEGGR